MKRVWIDDAGVTHMVFVQPDYVLGEQTVTWLRALTPDQYAALLAALNTKYDDVYDSAKAEIKAEIKASGVVGPADPDDLDAISVPPPCPPVELMPGEPPADAVMRLVNSVAGLWRVEVYEAFFEAVLPDVNDDEDDEDWPALADEQSQSPA